MGPWKIHRTAASISGSICVGQTHRPHTSKWQRRSELGATTSNLDTPLPLESCFCFAASFLQIWTCSCTQRKNNPVCSHQWRRRISASASTRLVLYKCQTNQDTDVCAILAQPNPESTAGAQERIERDSPRSLSSNPRRVSDSDSNRRSSLWNCCPFDVTVSCPKCPTWIPPCTCSTHARASTQSLHCKRRMLKPYWESN